MDEPSTAHALAACISEATSLGLQVNDTVVLHNSNRLAVRLAPSDALARVAPESRLDGAEFEVEVARRLADADSPLAELDPRVEPRVYMRSGFAITLWTYYEPVPPEEIAPAEYAHALERLHRRMREADLSRPWLESPDGQRSPPHFTDRVAGAQWLIAEEERTPELGAADREFLSETLRTLRRAITERGAREQLIHGEPHPGNVLRTTKGLRFIDLETCCRGPVEFDIAHAVLTDIGPSRGTPGEVSAHYAGVDHDLLRECWLLMLALVITWRWAPDDQLPNGRQRGAAWLRQLRQALDRS